MFLRPFLALMGLLFIHCVLAQPCQNIPGITATDTGLCLGESTTLSLDYTPPTMCDMNITPNPAPLGSAIPGFTYGGVHNGHLYYVYNSFTSWTQGELICRQSGGYLTCINDIFENSFVSNLTNNNIWIGMFRDPITCDFRWLDCMNISFTNWRPGGEPNNGPCGEPYVQIIRGCTDGLNTWNNLDDNGGALVDPCYNDMVPIMEIDPILYNNPTSDSVSYLWSTGDTTSSITVTPTSITSYWVDITIGNLTCRKFLTIDVDTPSQVIDTVSSCNEYTWPINGQTYTTSGIYIETVLTPFGCDSTVSLDLTINTTQTSVETEVACDSFVWNGQVYNTSGVYQNNYTAASGCDSLAALDLTIHPSYRLVIDSLTIESELVWEGQVLVESGDYEVTYTSSENCDSIYVLSLVFDLPVLSLPTAFSPNGDGINDFFKPVTYGGNVIILEIFNRWGEMVFREEGLFDMTGWDGTYKGDNAPTETYVYTIRYVDFGGTERFLQGNLGLFR